MSVVGALATAIVLVLLSASAQARPVKVHLWFNAFIPSVHPAIPDYIRKTQKGTYVLEAPDFIGPLKGTCFETDNRSFDLSPDASSRISVNVVLDISGAEMTVGPQPEHKMKRTGQSHNVDCDTGEELQPPKQAPEDSIVIGKVVKGDFVRTLFIDAPDANPFYPNVAIPGTHVYLGVSPDIDFKVSVRYEVARAKVFVTGTVGYFPSFEGYYSLNDGPVVPLYQLPPYEKSTAIDLIDLATGINTRNISGEIKLY
jgi:hypothetical protein